MAGNIWILIAVGMMVGAIGTLIGAGGGFILVPILLLTQPNLSPELVTAISLAIVCCNAISGTIAYSRAGRIDYKAGWQFFVFTIPGSIIGVLLTRFIPLHKFTLVFGCLLIILSVYLLRKRNGGASGMHYSKWFPANAHHSIQDRSGQEYNYGYNKYLGWMISSVVGFLSPILGIGGGVIHVPAMAGWLGFPVQVATATSHFILAAMSLVSVTVHILGRNYHDPVILRMVVGLGLGAVIGAQFGAWLSHKVRASFIIKALALALGLVGVRLILQFLA